MSMTRKPAAAAIRASRFAGDIGVQNTQNFGVGASKAACDPAINISGSEKKFPDGATVVMVFSIAEIAVWTRLLERMGSGTLRSSYPRSKSDSPWRKHVDRSKMSESLKGGRSG